MAPVHHVCVTLSGAGDGQKHHNCDTNNRGPFAQLQKAVVGFFLVIDIHGTMFVIRHFTLPFLCFPRFAMKPARMEAGLPAALRRGSDFLPEPRVVFTPFAANFPALMQVVKVPVSLHQCQTVFAFTDGALEQGRETLRRRLWHL